MLCTTIGGAQQASLAVIHARVWTGNVAHPWAEALAANGNTILAVGDTAAIQKLIAPRTRVLDARGGMVTPGFIDSHVHFLEGGLNLRSVQLRDVRTKEEFVARIKAFAATAPPGTWITGGDWDHQNWGGELPRKDWIDAATPRNPVWINRMDGHMSLANSLALAAAKVDKGTREVEGGAIVRDASGEPTGILKDNAKSLVDRAMPAPLGPDDGPRAGRGHEVRRAKRCHQRGPHGDVERPGSVPAGAKGRTAADPHTGRGTACHLGAVGADRGARGPRRRLSFHRLPQGFRRWIAGLAYGRLSGAVHRRA